MTFLAKCLRSVFHRQRYTHTHRRDLAWQRKMSERDKLEMERTLAKWLKRWDFSRDAAHTGLYQNATRSHLPQRTPSPVWFYSLPPTPSLLGLTLKYISTAAGAKSRIFMDSYEGDDFLNYETLFLFSWEDPLIAELIICCLSPFWKHSNNECNIFCVVPVALFFLCFEGIRWIKKNYNNIR